MVSDTGAAVSDARDRDRFARQQFVNGVLELAPGRLGLLVADAVLVVDPAAVAEDEVAVEHEDLTAARVDHRDGVR